MIESRDWYDPTSEVEAMVRAAGDYVQASEDLRPRVLETARAQSGEQRAQRCIRQVALFVVLLAIFTPSGRHRLETGDAPQQRSLAAADSESMFSRAETIVARSGGDLGWGMVEAFTELRRRQAEVFRLTL